MTREQILAFRYHRHHLDRSLTRKDIVESARAGFQTGVPGTTLLALAARIKDLKAADLEDALQDKKSLVEVHCLREATYIVPSEDFAIFTKGVYPTNEDDLGYFMRPGTGQLKANHVDIMEVVDAAAKVMREVLKNKALTQDEIHAEWRKKLPKKFLWECRGCKSFHLHYSVVASICANGEACFGPMIDGDSAFTLAKNWLPKTLFDRAQKMKQEDASHELVRRYLQFFGPADVSMFASWAGISKHQASEIWKLLENELLEIPFAKKTLFLLKKDQKEFNSAKSPKGVHLLPARDPFLDQRDREIIIPEKKLHSKVWKVLANPGALLVDGEVEGTWRVQKKGKTLNFGFETFHKPSHAIKSEIDLQCERITMLRGCESFKLEIK